MTGENGKPESLRDVVNTAIGGFFSDDGTLLRDLEKAFPYVRKFLIGGRRNSYTWPAGEFRIALNGNMVQVTLAVRALEIEAKYYDSSYSTMLDTIENDLSLDTVNWCPDYKGRQRLEKKLLT